MARGTHECGPYKFGCLISRRRGRILCVPRRVAAAVPAKRARKPPGGRGPRGVCFSPVFPA